MPTDRPHSAPLDTSTFLFPAEWQSMSDIFAGSNTGLLFTRDGIITHVNSTLEEQLGFDAAELIGKPARSILMAGNSDTALDDDMTGASHARGTQVRIASKSGASLDCHLIINSTDTLLDGAGTGAVWILQPITHATQAASGTVPAAFDNAQVIIEQLPDPVLLCTADTTLRYANPSLTVFLGHHENAWTGSRLIDQVHPEDQPKLLDVLSQLADRDTAPLGFRLRHRDGSWRQMTGQGRNLLALRDINGLLLTLRDVTDQMQEQQRVAADKKRQLHYLNRLLRLAQHPHPHLDSALKVILKASAKALGTHRCAYWEMGESPSATRCVMAYDEVRQNLVTEVPDVALAAAFHPLLQQVMLDERALAVADVDLDPLAATACEYFHAALVKAIIIVPVQHADKVVGMLVFSHLNAARVWRNDEAEFASQGAGLISLILREIERAKSETQVRHLTHQDSLTGLPNRQFLFERAADIFPQMTKNAMSLAVFFIDLDGLKHVNDSLGHAIGDELLKAVALRLKNLVRKDDVLARLGGDEFMLLAQNLNDMRIAEDIAQQIIDAMNAPFSLRGNELQVSVSVGIALYPFDGNDIDTLMKKADIALHHAKSGGRNRYQAFSPRQANRVSAQSVLEGELRRAIREHELQHYYQPQIDLRTGKVRCVEALLRWHHPRKGLLAPATFLPLSERSGLIHHISKWVMNDVCDQLKLWREKGFEQFNIAVNLSAGQLADEALLTFMEDALERTGVVAAQLEWEIRESTVMRHDTLSASLLDRLVDLQIGLSIDDFGTGYSNLGYLRRYPVRKVKIDRSFINSLPDEGDGRAITDAIILMAQPLGLDVVAEGVETPQQMEYLRSRGCHIAQGFYFTQPLTADQFESWLIRH